MTPLDGMGRYATVVVDPPWPLGKMGLRKYASELPYRTMTMDDIRDLPIESLLLDDSLVFLFTVNKYIGDAIAMLDRWGAPYSYTMTWVKNGGSQYPNTPCFNAEFIVVGRRGSPRYLDTKSFKTANYWPREAHSVKPQGFYNLLSRVTPAPRLDVFARRRIHGFDGWGDQYSPDGPTQPPLEI